MKRLLWITLFLGGAVLVLLTNKKNIQASTMNMSDSLTSHLWMQSTSKERIARVKRGDTLAMTNEELINLLPISMKTYHPAGVAGSSLVNLMGSQYRVAEQTYHKGKQTLKVAIVDYNAAYTLYNVATATFDAGITINNNEQLVQRIELGAEDVKGWETFDKKEHKASVFVGIAERFLITIEATNQDNTQELETIVRELDLEDFVSK